MGVGRCNSLGKPSCYCTPSICEIWKLKLCVWYVRNYNYGEAGKYLGINVLSNPDLVAQNPAIAFKTSIWYWAVYSNCHRAMTSSGGSGFAGTIRSINPGECGNPAYRSAVQSRVNYYEKFCSWLGVSPGTNLYC